MALCPETVANHFEEIEQTAEEALSDQQEIITLDRRRNLNREALRQLTNNTKCLESSQSWVCVGNLFMRLPRKKVLSSIQKEQEKLDSEIHNLRNGLRTKVDHLNTLEGKPLTRGSGLTALSKDEWDAMKKVLGP